MADTARRRSRNGVAHDVGALPQRLLARSHWRRDHLVERHQGVPDGEPQLLSLSARHVTTKHYVLWTNGKAERFIRIAMREWLYARPYRSFAS